MLPADPIILLSYINTQLRDHYASLDALCADQDADKDADVYKRQLCAQRLTFGNIPEENTLHYLSGRIIKLADPEIVKQFDALERKPGQE